MTKRELSKKEIGVIAGLLLFSVAMALAVVYRHQIASLFTEVDTMRNWVLSFGVWAPVLFTVLQFLQVVIAPIPGQVTATLGGMLFGWWGMVFSMLGAMLGYYVVFRVAERCGRPLAEKLFSDKTIDHFDYVTESKSPLLLFMIFVLPIFPDDLICYLAGMTKTSTRRLMWAAFWGRIPSFLLANLAGMGLGSHDLGLVLWITGAVVLVMALGYWQFANMEKLVRGKLKWPKWARRK